jgi:hypothetical protein
MPRKGSNGRTQRLRRPEIGRTEPVRKWETLFGPPPNQADSADDPRPSAESDATNPIARGVELGYRVMDEYVRQGTRFAGLRSGGAAGGGGSVGRVAESTATGLPQLTERMFQYASDFASVWLEAMGVMMRNGGAAGMGGPRTASNGAAAPVAADPPEEAPSPRNGTHKNGTHKNGTSHGNGTISLAVDVTSRRPVRAAVDLRSGSIDEPVVVQDLRSRDPRRPRLKGITLEAAPNGKQLTLRLKVANRHPAGEYVGAIVDRSTGVTRGTLTVTVGERAS